MAASAGSLSTALTTTLALIDQFQHSLASSSALSDASASPLPLLAASAATLKSQTTKLSLLALTAPFTPSAVAALLNALNDAILPSVLTATLLLTPKLYSSSFSAEAGALTRATLRDLKPLIQMIETRNRDRIPTSELNTVQKQEITEATGRVWSNCDTIISFSDGGLPGFAVKKATQWLDLMKDAVKELQDWDPDEDEDDADVFGDALGHNRDVDGYVVEPEKLEHDAATAAIRSGVKDQALKVLTRVPQSIHVVVKQRLQYLPQPADLSISQRSTIDEILHNTQQISECIDESAEGMYMGDLEGCLKKAGEARQLCIEVVESVVDPWVRRSDINREETKEDRYVKKALDWIRVVEPGGRSRPSIGKTNGV